MKLPIKFLGVLAVTGLMVVQGAWGQAVAEPQSKMVVTAPALVPTFPTGKRYEFGWCPVKSQKNIVFTVQNQGLGELSGLEISVSGAQASEFRIVQPPAATTMAAGQKTSFTVQFTPHAVGSTRIAELTLRSNDVETGPLKVTLTGQGGLPGISVSDSNNVPILRGAVYDMGGIAVHTRSSTQIVVRSTGVGPLHLKAVEKSGPNPGDFGSYTGSGVNLEQGQGWHPGLYFQPKAYGPRSCQIKILSDDPGKGEYEVTLTGTGLRPGMQVLTAEGAYVQESDYQILAGVTGGPPINKTYTITNPTDKTLTLAAALKGENAAYFSIITPPAAMVSPGGSTTMTVQFAPWIENDRLFASVVLTHNTWHPTLTSEFYLNLRGNAQRMRLGFTEEVFHVPHGTGTGRVKLGRTLTSAPAEVVVRTFNGPSSWVPLVQAAMEGVDYWPMPAQGPKVRFEVGEAEKTVDVSLRAPASGKNVARQLRVMIMGGSSGVWVERRETLLRIEGKDSTQPTLQLTHPVAGRADTMLPMKVRGTAGDARGIDRVEVTLNGGTPMRAELYHTDSPRATPFIASITPAEGENTLVVTAYDAMGNSTTVTRSFTLGSRRRQLTLFTPTHHGQQAGIAALTATPADAASAPVVEPGYGGPLSTAEVAPGAVVKLVATPKAGFLFHRWTSINEPDLGLTRQWNTVTFTMPDADVRVDAEFKPSPFVRLIGRTNEWRWLLRPQGSQPLADFATEGYLVGTITAAGRLSARLQVAGVSVPVVADLNTGGPALFTVAGKQSESLPYPGGELRLEVDVGGGSIHATMTSTTGVTSIGLGKRVLYDGIDGRVYQEMLNSPTRGYFTMQLAPATSGPGYPAGHGYATMQLTPIGRVTLVAVLADDTKVTMSTALVALEHTAPVFIQVPTPGGTTKHGLVTGELAFYPAGIFGDVTGLLRWYRPAAVSPKVRVYPLGWPGGMDLDAEGAHYNSATPVQTALDLPTVPAGTGHATLIFDDGRPNTALGVTNFQIRRNSVVKFPASDRSFTLTLDPGMGFFSGSFTPMWMNDYPTLPKPTFRGVILQSPGLRRGAGFFINPMAKVGAPVSGSVRLEK